MSAAQERIAAMRRADATCSTAEERAIRQEQIDFAWFCAMNPDRDV